MAAFSRLGRVVSGLALLPAAAAAQQELWSLEGKDHSEHLGYSIALLRDRTGDGIAELLVGAPAAGGDDRGAVRVFSGATLALLLDLRGDKDRERGLGFLDRFGVAVATPGDIDGDGFDDLLVGDPTIDRVELFAGSDGRLLDDWTGTTATDFGRAIVPLGDLDGDGAFDLAIGSPLEVGTNGMRGVVTIVSGATKFALQRFESSTDGGPLSIYGDRDRLIDAGDVDGDGFRDLALLDIAPSASAGMDTAVLRVYSSRTGAALATTPFDGATQVAYDFRSVARLGDFDGDGAGDYILGAIQRAGIAPTIAVVVSGATGLELARHDAPGAGTYAVAGSAGDLDGDAIPELLLASDRLISTAPSPSLRVFRGSDGLVLADLRGATSHPYGRAFVAGADFSGDGIGDVAIGIPDLPDSSIAPFDQYKTGAVELRALPSGAALRSVIGRAEYEPIDGLFAAFLDDVDGDGFNDLVVPNRQILRLSSVRIRSGRDGALLAEPFFASGLPVDLASLPDQDGDGHVDFAVTVSDFATSAALEIRSGVSGALLRSIAAPSFHWSWGSPLEVAVPATGPTQIAVAAPDDGAGRVDFFDPVAGALLYQFAGANKGDRTGIAVASVGDLDSDGVDDWAVGSPYSSVKGYYSGRVQVLSGVTGAPFRAIGGTSPEQLGWAIAPLGDDDGDGKPDFLVGAPIAGNGLGEARLYSGASFRPLATWTGRIIPGTFGLLLQELGDVNRDGAEDFVASYDQTSEVRGGNALLALASEGILDAAPKWIGRSPSGDKTPDLLLMHPRGRLDAWPSGRYVLWALDDLMLQITPDVAPVGITVEAALRGGRPVLPLALELVTVGGAPVHLIVATDVFDGLGEWTIDDIVPAGLSGIVAEFRGYGLDYNGKVMKSLVQSLTFR